jgi:hypothetical protein
VAEEETHRWETAGDDDEIRFDETIKARQLLRFTYLVIIRTSIVRA